MSAALAAALVLVPAYLLGALPWGLWVGFARGLDVRRHGSGNLGATNVYRTLGPRYGLLVLALDAAKGAGAVAWAHAGPWGGAFPGGAEWAALGAGLAAIVGHVLTVFAGLRGGRGVATTVGVFLALAPLAMLLGLAAFVVAFALTRRVSVGSLALSLVYPAGIWWTVHGPGRTRLFVLGLAVSALIVYRHWPNIRRLVRGEEPRIALCGRGGGTAAGAPGAGGGAAGPAGGQGRQEGRP
jgi:glycerol-3-phosphate acyltransferase PlsY